MALMARDDTTTNDSPSRPPPGRIRVGSPQQEAFWAELVRGDGNLLLEARAGTGKSSSCREGMHRILADRPRAAIRYCCFNKKIAEEFRSGCPDGVEVGTMHAFGLKALTRAFRCEMRADKSYMVLDTITGGKDLPRYLRKSVATLVGHAKNRGLSPGADDLEETLEDLAVEYDVECYRRLGTVISFALDVLVRSAELTAVVDFDDMIWIPTIYDVSFPTVDYLFIDECQDLNPVQHLLVERLNPSGRTIVVGDPYQAVYGFRGADSDSIPRLREVLGARTMPLTVTWRCPRLHVEQARTLVPDFEAAPNATDGVLIEEEANLDAIEAEPGDLVLCRANAPLISACLGMIREGRRAIVRGRALGESLKAIARKIKGSTTSDFVRGLAHWEAAEIERLSNKDGTDHLIEMVTDQAACLEAIADGCPSPAEIPGAIDHLFADDDADNRVTFSSVHRAKGSEARVVHYLQIPYGTKRDRDRPPPQWELDQRRNLRYVALTRSLHHLSLLTPTRRKS